VKTPTNTFWQLAAIKACQNIRAGIIAIFEKKSQD
jgi:hypothetical protein